MLIISLSGVVNQVGANNYGHYFSFVYDDNLEKWLLCNDERVQFMDEYKVINSDNAYLLFYQKV
jgi:ubiquitin C-terminal hydrolase